MQLHTTLSKVVTNVDSPAKTFTINASQKAFKILSSNLYQNKIQAIIRELSTNAADAHTAAGNKEPFQVHLPSSLESYFSVRDFGTGMSEESIYDLYTSYFSSSKANSDDYIGALGLGSKSPFSYVESFTLESIYGGEKKLYNAFLSAEGLPQILLISSEVTEEHNGMSISFPVATGDLNTFITEATRVYFAFDELPAFVGSSSKIEAKILELKESTKVLLKSDTWVLYSNRPSFFKESYCEYDFSSVAYARMGSTLYPIEAEPLKPFKNDPAVKFALKNNFVFSIPLGLVDINPSRESLSYDKETILNLFNFFQEVYKEFQSGSVFKDIIDSPLSNWNKSCKLSEIIGTLKGGLTVSYTDTKTGKVYRAGQTIDIQFKNPCQIFNFVRYNRGTRLETPSTGPTTDLKITISPKTAILVGKASPHFLKRVKMWMRDSHFKFVVLFDKELCDEDLEALGGPTVHTSAELPKTNNGSGSKKSIKDIKVTNYMYSADLIDLETQDVRYVILKSQGFYILEGDSLIKIDKEDKLPRVLASVKEHFDKDLRVAVVPWPLVSVVRSLKTWKPLMRDYIKKIVEAEEDKIGDYIRLSNTSHIAYDLTSLPFLDEEKIEASITDPNSIYLKAKALRKGTKFQEDQKKKNTISILSVLNSYLGRSQSERLVEEDTLKELKEISAAYNEAYPLLQFLPSYSYHKPENAAVIHYINLVDKENNTL